MSEIVRTKTRIEGPLTEEEKVRLKAHADKWIEIAVSTAPVHAGRLTDAIRSLYAAADLKAPRVVVVPSPLAMALAGGFAAAIWWARKNRQLKAAVPAEVPDELAADPVFSAALKAIQAAVDGPVEALNDFTLPASSAAPSKARRSIRAFSQYVGGVYGIDPDLLLECAKQFRNMYQGGNMWASWDCYVTAFRDVLGLDLPQYVKFKTWENCALEGGFRVVHDEFCIVSDRPEVLAIDSRNRPRPHNETGPSHRWRDGWSLYYIHGVRVPDDVVEDRASITVARIKKEKNAEVRRVMTELYGYDRYCQDAKLTLVDECPADHPMKGLRTARLWREDGGTADTALTLLDVLNSTPEPDGTTRRYVIAVDPNAYGGRAGRECVAASASTWRNRANPERLFYEKVEDYCPQYES